MIQIIHIREQIIIYNKEYYYCNNNPNLIHMCKFVHELIKACTIKMYKFLNQRQSKIIFLQKSGYFLHKKKTSKILVTNFVNRFFLLQQTSHVYRKPQIIRTNVTTGQFEFRKVWITQSILNLVEFLGISILTAILISR